MSPIQAPHLTLNRRCALFTLVAFAMAAGVGLLAWGPLPRAVATPALAHNGGAAASCLPMLFAALWAWNAVERAAWPLAVRRPWIAAFASLSVASCLDLAYHLAPGSLVLLAAHTASACAFLLVLCAFLAERMNERFGSTAACATVALLTLLAGAAAFLSDVHQMDLRPLLWLQLLPLVLLLPTGAMSLPGSCTRRADWLLILGLYALAGAADFNHFAVLAHTGLNSAHALMHLCIALLAVHAGRRAAQSLRQQSALQSVVAAAEAPTQDNTALNTSG